MNQIQCIQKEGCSWIENIQIESCNDIQNAQECWANNCIWYNGNYYVCSICCWGDYIVDNSFCEEIDYITGDINQDNLINVMDVILAINVILNNQYEQLADINSDYIVNVIDMILLVNFILQE